MEKFYVTTPIYYATDKPHIGHAYTTIAADVLARHYRQKLDDERVFSLVGTDEHGAKVAEAAQKAGQDPQAFVDAQAETYKNLWQKLTIKADFFIRTTDPGHTAFASSFIQKLYDRGVITKGVYEGLYCVGCEKFLVESELVDGRCPDHPTMEPVHHKEENYFFKLSEWAPKVRELIENDTIRILPAHRRNEILSRLSDEVHDISISRAAVSWGIPIPWDTTQTVYVWVEALLNYASALDITQKGTFWPPDVQLMGKEILWFHAVIWPALLLAAGKTELDLPKTIFAHGWFTVDGHKMSKTLGNVIDPADLIQTYGVDAVRYFLLSATGFGNDGDISEDRFHAQYTADLSNGLGNLLQRTLVLCNKFDVKPNPGAPESLTIGALTEALQFDEALKSIWDLVNDANGQLDREAPWTETDPEKRTKTLTEILQQLSTIAEALKPYLPETAEKMEAQLRSKQPPTPLFPRLG